MNEDQMKEFLGDSYKEGITVEEINQIMKEKFTVDNSETINDLKKQISEYKKKEKANLSDDEKKAAELQEKLDRIAELEEENRQNKIENTKSKVEAKLTGILDICDSEIKDIQELINNISGEEVENSTKTAEMIVNLIKKAHEKGKSDNVKDHLGKMGQEQGDIGGSGEDSLGKRLAQKSLSKLTTQESKYFKIN